MGFLFGSRIGDFWFDSSPLFLLYIFIFSFFFGTLHRAIWVGYFRDTGLRYCLLSLVSPTVEILVDICILLYI